VRADARPTAVRRAGAAPAASHEPPPEPMPTIAVVEDNEDNRFVIAMMVGDIGEIAEYATGPAALAAFESGVPDLVLLDIALPGMDGVEVVRRMRADSTMRAVPVIALTAHAMRGDRERYLAAGCNDYVSKPIEDLEQFRALVQSFVARAA
jgi:two-component system, cell cycle response regulator DivK